MYPLNAIIVSPDLNLIPQIKRELSNRSVRLEAEFAEVSDLIQALRRSSAEKRLLIFHMASIRELDGLRRLAVHFPSWPIVALIEGYEPKGSLGEVIVEVMRAGASQIISLPIQSDDFKAALDRIALQFVYAARNAKVIAVAGATGGSGATTIALNLAYEIAERKDLRCVLVDLSLRMGVVASHLNIEPTHTIIDLLRDINRVDTFLTEQALTKITDHFKILAGPNKLTATATTSSQDLAHVVDTLKQIADVIVLDVPCTYNDLYFDTIAAADQTILIGEQKLPSIRALKMVREAIHRTSETEHLVINQFDPKNKGFGLEHLLKPLGVTVLHKVARDDLGMIASMNEACTLRTASSRSPALADIVALVDTVMPVDATSRIKPVGLLGRLGRAFAHS
jgi:Flp pilus assembly CpaE family ATPase